MLFFVLLCCPLPYNSCANKKKGLKYASLYLLLQYPWGLRKILTIKQDIKIAAKRAHAIKESFVSSPQSSKEHGSGCCCKLWPGSSTPSSANGENDFLDGLKVQFRGKKIVFKKKKKMFEETVFINVIQDNKGRPNTFFFWGMTNLLTFRR